MLLNPLFTGMCSNCFDLDHISFDVWVFFFLQYVFRMVVWLQGISCLVWMAEVWWAYPRKGMEWVFLREEDARLMIYWNGVKLGGF